MGPPRLAKAAPLRGGAAGAGRARCAPRPRGGGKGTGGAPLNALRRRVPAAGRAQPARRSREPGLTTMAGRRTPPPMGLLSPESAKPAAGGSAAKPPEVRRAGRQRPRALEIREAAAPLAKVRRRQLGPNRGSEGGARRIPRVGGKSQSPPGPRPAPAPARRLPGAHMAAAPLPGSGRAALHLCSHSSSSSSFFFFFPPPHSAGGEGKEKQPQRKNKIKK